MNMTKAPLMPVEEALARVLAGAGPLGTERVALAEAQDRVLAEPLAARRTQPPFAASSMDGYAVRAADAARAPATLRVTGEVPAGALYQGRLGPGEAIRIFTGAPVPDGADAIVIQENTTREGDRVTVLQAARAGAHIRPAGLDFSAGDVLLDAGLRLLPRHLSLAASMNCTAVPARRRPKVAILATGDELVPPGVEPGPGQIVSSNSIGIAGAVARAGAEAIDLGIAPDDAAALAAAVGRARDGKADILVTLGGASVGDHDLVMDVLKQEGLDLDFWRIAMRPGKPLIFGRLGDMRVLGLPGNPVSAIVCARIFLIPLIDALLGLAPRDETPETALTAVDLAENDLRQDHLRARLERRPDGALMAVPFERQDSSMLALLARADCLILRPPHAPAAQAGTPVPILRLDTI